MNNKFTLGKCKYCKEYKPLKNGVCKECEDNKVGGTGYDLPECFKDIFDGFDEERNK